MCAHARLKAHNLARFRRKYKISRQNYVKVWRGSHGLAEDTVARRIWVVFEETSNLFVNSDELL